MDEVPEGADVVLQLLRERQRLPDDPGAPLAEGAEGPLDVVRPPRPLVTPVVPVRRQRRGVCLPQVGVELGPRPAVAGQGLPQPPGAALVPAADEHGQHPPGVRVPGHPHPPPVSPLAHERPEFVALHGDPPPPFSPRPARPPGSARTRRSRAPGARTRVRPGRGRWRPGRSARPASSLPGPSSSPGWGPSAGRGRTAGRRPGTCGSVCRPRPGRSSTPDPTGTTGSAAWRRPPGAGRTTLRNPYYWGTTPKGS